MIGKKRKLIVPVVAIMMCAVALAGVAYAYTSSVVDDGANSDQDYAALVFTDQGGTEKTTGTLGAATGITFTTVTDIRAPLVTVNADGTATISAYFKLDSDKQTANYTVNGVVTLKNAQGATVTSVTVTGAAQDHNTVTFAVGNQVIRLADDSADAPATLVKGTPYLIKFTVTPTCDVQFANATAIADATAVVSAVNAIHYTLELTATSAQ